MAVARFNNGRWWLWVSARRPGRRWVCSTPQHQQRLSSPHKRGSSTPRPIGSIIGVSGILGRPPTRAMTAGIDLPVGSTYRNLHHTLQSGNFPKFKKPLRNLPRPLHVFSSGIEPEVIGRKP